MTHNPLSSHKISIYEKDIIELLFEKTSGIKPIFYMKQGIFNKQNRFLKFTFIRDSGSQGH